MRFRTLGILVLVLVAAIAPAPLYSQSNRAAGSSKSALVNPQVQVVMRNVVNHFNDQVAVHIIQAKGTMTPSKAGGLIVLDDTNSFTVNLASAEITVTCDSLANMLNQNVFSSSSAPVKDITIAGKDNKLNFTGKLRRKGDIPFEAIGALSLEPDGRIRLHTDHIRAAHVPVKGLMELLGLDVAKLISTKKISSIAAEKDDLLIDPEQILPPPRIHGRLTAIRVEGNDVVEVFGPTLAPPNFAAKESGNFIAYRGGTVRLGNLSMDHTDVVLIDLDPGDPFDVRLDHYKEQFGAGYVKTTPDMGVRVYVRDYNKLPVASKAK